MIPALDVLFDLKWEWHQDYIQGKLSKQEWERMNRRYDDYINVYGEKKNGSLYSNQ